MKTEILSISGEKVKEIELPSVFSTKVREDVIKKVFEAEKQIQPYSPDPMAGRKQSASGRIRHIRHKWRTAYGRGISRVPRKTMWRRGTQFYWIGAEASGTRGGRRAHPPKIAHWINFNNKKINKKEKEFALNSAIASTIEEASLKTRYSNISNSKIKKLPIIVESKVTELKTKDLLNSLRKILGELFTVAEKKSKSRAGKGNMRNRRNKKSAGILIVTGNNETMKNKSLESKKIKELSVSDFWPLGRLTVYTESAIKELDKIDKKKKVEENKNND